MHSSLALLAVAAKAIIVSCFLVLFAGVFFVRIRTAPGIYKAWFLTLAIVCLAFAVLLFHEGLVQD